MGQVILDDVHKLGVGLQAVVGVANSSQEKVRALADVKLVFFRPLDVHEVTVTGFCGGHG